MVLRQVNDVGPYGTDGDSAGGGLTMSGPYGTDGDSA
jgi:hypothetical protein